MRKISLSSLAFALFFLGTMLLLTPQSFAQSAKRALPPTKSSKELQRLLQTSANSLAERATPMNTNARLNTQQVQPAGGNGTLSPQAMWDIQFIRNVDSASNVPGTAGIVWTGTEFWVSRWNDPDTLLSFSATGTFTGIFSITGMPATTGLGIRAFTSDGTNIYAANNSTTIYKISPTTKAVIGSFTVPATVGAVRWITYDGAGSFWCGNFNTSLFKINNPASGTATVATSIPAATHTLGGMYGAAYDATSTGGPYLWMFVQTSPTGGTNQATIAQLQMPSGTFTNVTRNVNADLGSTTGLAGGLHIAQLPGLPYRSLIALDQGVKVIGYELNFVQTFIPDIAADSIDPSNALTFWPLAQNGPVNFGGKARNVGTATATTVTSQVKIEDGVGTTLATFNAPSVASIAQGGANIYQVGPFTAPTKDTYIATAVSDAANDNLPDNDTTAAIFVVSDSTFARDYASFGVAVGGLGVGAAANTNKKLGQVFTLNIPSPLTSITFYLSSPFAGQTVSASVYGVTGGVPDQTPIASTAIYTITQTDQDSGVVLTLTPIGGNVQLPAGDFLVSVDELGDSTAGLATTPYIYTPNKMFVKWDANQGGAWTDVGLFGANFKRAFVIRPNFGYACAAMTSLGTVTKQVTCFGGSDGQANVSASGGTAPYTYAWSPSGGNQASAIGLSAGTYTVNIADANGCPAPQVLVTVTQPTQVVNTATNIVGSPVGQNLGSATVNTTGGTPGYTYAWSPSGGNQATATGLAPGSYTVTVTDSKGCITTLVVVIPAVVSINPATAGIANWNLFPNPSNGVFNMQLSLTQADDVQITVLDLTGKAVFAASKNQVTEWNETIQLSLASGVYMMQVRTSKGAVHQRIMID